VGPSTRFAHYATLTYEGGAYVWDRDAPQPLAVSLGTSSPGPGLLRLVGITLRAASRSVGYVWQASGLGVPACGGGGPLDSAYLMQNVGTVDPGGELMTLACGFSLPTNLAYDNSARPGALSFASSQAFFLDPRPPAWSSLRSVALRAGSFDVSATTSLGRFRAGPPNDLVIHPSGYAAAVFFSTGTLEVLKRATAPVADAQAPSANPFCGSGSRVGLLALPVAVAVSAGGFLLVLESGNRRIQAFDVHGNTAPLFGGSPVLPLNLPNGAFCLDLAASANGAIYVLWSVHSPATAADFSLDLYGSDGKFLSRTAGVNAERIAVDSRERVYTLNYGSITGNQGRIEPSISVWVPSQAS
jgi:hypothetical protein